MKMTHKKTVRQSSLTIAALQALQYRVSLGLSWDLHVRNRTSSSERRLVWKTSFAEILRKYLQYSPTGEKTISLDLYITSSPIVLLGRKLKSWSWCLRISRANSLDETTNVGTEPRDMNITGPYLSANFCSDWCGYNPRSSRFPMTGQPLGPGGKFLERPDNLRQRKTAPSKPQMHTTIHLPFAVGTSSPCSSSSIFVNCSFFFSGLSSVLLYGFVVGSMSDNDTSARDVYVHSSVWMSKAATHSSNRRRRCTHSTSLPYERLTIGTSRMGHKVVVKRLPWPHLERWNQIFEKSDKTTAESTVYSEMRE